MENGCIKTSRYMEFNKEETKEYFEWLDSLSPKRFELVSRYEWNKILLLFGKGVKNFELNLSLEEKEEIYGGD